MRVRRRTAVLLGAAALAASAGALAFALLQPERIRGTVLGVVRGALADGYDAELDAVEFDVGAGLARATGLRILRASPAREVVISVPRLEAEVRSWEFLRHGRVSLLRLRDPEVLLEIGEDGTASLAGVLRDAGTPADGEPAARPRVLVEGGLLRVRVAGVLAEGEEVRLRIEKADLQEARSGGVSSLEAVLIEEGAPGRGGAGALGRIVAQGEVPLRRRGLRVLVDRFHLDGDLLARLGPEIRRHFEGFRRLEGPLGEGPDAPGLEVALSAPRPEEPVQVDVLLRPRGLRVLHDAFPVAFQEVRGECGLRGGEVVVDHLALRRARGEIHLQGRGRLEEGAPRGEVRFWGRDIDFDRELHDAMPPDVRQIWDAYDLGGVVDFTVAPRGTDGSYDGRITWPSGGGPVEVVAKAQLVDGSLSYKGYPDEQGVRQGFDFPVTGATGRLEFRMPVEGDAHEITLADLRGFTVTGGPARAHGSIVEWPGGRARVDVHVEADEVALDETVRNGSEGMRERFRVWSPRGIARRIHVHVEQDPDRDATAGTTITMTLDGRAGFTWIELPLPVDGLQGILDVRDETVEGERIQVTTVRGLRGRVGESPVTADGTVEGTDDPRLQITADFRNLALEGALRTAAEIGGHARLLDLYRKMDPRGPIDLHAVISGTDARRREVFEVTLRGVSAKGWDAIDWPTEGITGTVLVSPEEIELKGLGGRGPEGPVSIAGKVLDPGGAARLDLVVRAGDAPLDARLGERLPAAAERLREYYRTVAPGEGLRGDATVTLRGTGDDLRTEVLVERLAGPIAPLGLRGLRLGAGTVRLAGDALALEGVEGAFEDRTFRLRAGSVDLASGIGSFEAEARRLRFPQDLVPVISEETARELDRIAPDRWVHAERLVVGVRDGFRTVVLDGPVALSPPREGATGGLGLEGVFELRGVTLARGPADDDPTALSGSIGITGGRFRAGLQVEELAGTVDLSGVVGPAGNTIAARLSDASARVEGRSLVRAGAEVSFPPGGVLVKDLRGTLAGGSLDASIQVGPGGQGQPALEGRFSLGKATARGLFAPGDPKSEMEGLVDGFLWLRNPTGRDADLLGEGRLVLADGKLFKVPVFEAIYGVVAPKSAPEFSGMRLRFDLKGDRVRFEEIFLDSRVVALHKASGASYAWLDGRLDAKLRPELKGVLRYPLVDILVAALSIPVREVYERMHIIHVGGTLQNPEVGNRVFPVLFGAEAKDGTRFLPPPPAVTVEPRAPIDF